MHIHPSVIPEQHLKLGITGKMVQFMLILQLPASELNQYLMKEADENPFLEIEWKRERFPDYTVRDFRREAERRDGGVDAIGTGDETLESYVLGQLRMNGVPRDILEIAEFLAGNLNGNGYLEITLEEAEKMLGADPDKLREALKCLQSCEPAGVGARTLRECLQLQILHHPERSVPFAWEIVGSYLEPLAKGKLDWIAGKLGASREEIEAAVRFIRFLNPRPGANFHRAPQPNLHVDAKIVKEGGQYIVVMNEELIPLVRINGRMMRMGEAMAEAKEYFREKLRAAKWLQRCLEQRKSTLQKVIERIADRQSEFLDNGIGHLKPLNLKAIAQELSFHESTVSRAIQNKFVQTPQGIHELKFFFSNGVTTESGALVSSRYVKEKIRKLIDAEDKRRPLSDRKIQQLLETAGIKIARRTVMKYREEMHILSSRYRSIRGHSR